MAFVKIKPLCDGGGKSSNNREDSSAYWNSQKNNSSSNNNTGKESSYKPQQSAPESEIAVAAAEAERKAKIEAYEIMRKGIKDVNAELYNASADLLYVIGMLNGAYSGEMAKSILNAMESNVEEINQIGEKLNNIDRTAAQKEIELGGIPNLSDSETYKSFKPFQYPIDDGVYRCNIDVMRDAVSIMDSINGRLYKAKEATYNLPKNLEGCETINDVPSQINNAESDISGTRTGLEKEADIAEETERKNVGIIERLLNFVNGIFDKIVGAFDKGSVNKEQEPEKTYVNMEGFPKSDFNRNTSENSPVIKKATPSLKDNQEQDLAEHYLEILAGQNDVDIEGKSNSEILEEIAVKLLAKENGIDTEEKNESQIIEELAKEKGVETTIEIKKAEKGKFGEIPLFDQLDYYYVRFGAGNIRSSGCGPTSLCMLWSAATGETHSPEELMRLHEEYGRYYIAGSGCSDELLQNEEALSEMNLKLEGNYYWGDAWGEGKLEEALRNGYTAIWRTQDKNFTGSGHYLVITGITEDGKILVNDPNGENYMSDNPILVDGFANGFNPDEFSTFGGNFYVYSVKEDIAITNQKDEKEILKEVLESEEGTQVADLINKFKEDLGDESYFNSELKENTEIKNNIPEDVTLEEIDDFIEKYPEIPLYDQKASDYKKFGCTIKESGCGITAYAMVLSYLLDKEVRPEELADKYISTYWGNWGTEARIFEDTAEIDWQVGVTHETWAGGWRENKVMEALKNGQPVIALVYDNSIFTDSGHYIVLEGLTEDGKIKVKDPNGNNYKKGGVLADGFENGFAPETFSNLINSHYYIFDAKEDLTNISVDGDEIEAEEMRDITQEVLTAPKGFNECGPSGSETWYDLDMTGVIKNMETLFGYTDLEYKIREDGVKILSGKTPDGQVFNDLVMVAADVKHSTNPDGVFERGQIVETSLGTGMVVDYCERSVNVRKSDGQIHFDIATAWCTEPYMSRAYNENEEELIDTVLDTETNSENIDIINISNDVRDETINVSDIIINENNNNKTNVQEKEKLTAEMGLNRNGPSGSETWYPDAPIGAVEMMMQEEYGFKDLEMTIREDGVRILSGTKPNGETFKDLVVVAADIKHSTNPDGVFERGDIVETSLGTGIVVDYCQKSVDERKSDGHIHLNIATTW